MKKLFVCLASLLLLSSCWKEKREEVLGYAPVYGNPDDLNTITLTGPRTLENGGKIYIYNNVLYQVEAGKGIHITDISDPSSPEKKGFLNIFGAQELAVKDNLVFTNNQKDLVILRIENDNAVSTVRRLQNSFKSLFNTSVPPERGRFECPDPKKGIVIGWQKKTLINPACSY